MKYHTYLVAFSKDKYKSLCDICSNTLGYCNPDIIDFVIDDNDIVVLECSNLKPKENINVNDYASFKLIEAINTKKQEE
jgi:hypothetical protein